MDPREPRSKQTGSGTSVSEQADLISAVSELHHELRSPVNTIINMAALARREPASGRVEEYLSGIEQAAQRLLGVIDDVVALSTPGDGQEEHWRSFCLCDLLEDLHASEEAVGAARRCTFFLAHAEHVPEWLSGPVGALRKGMIQVVNLAVRRLSAGSLDISFIWHEQKGQKPKSDAAGRLDVTFEAQTESVESAREAARLLVDNPRVMLVRRGLDRVDGSLEIGSVGGHVQIRLSIPCMEDGSTTFGEEIDKTIYLLARKGLASDLVARRLALKGFKVEREGEIAKVFAMPEGRFLGEHVADLFMVEWALFQEFQEGRGRAVGGDNGQSGLVGLEDFTRLGGKVLFFDVPAVKVLEFSRLEEKGFQEVGFLMSGASPEAFWSELDLLLGLHGSIEGQRAERASTVSRDAVSALQHRDLSGCKILVVEDDKINQRIILDILKRYGASPIVASNGKAALKAVDKMVFEAILMDIKLPDTDGVSLARKIRALGVGWPIVALTASTSDRKACFNAGMDAFLTKPYEEVALIETLGRLIRDGRRA